VPDLRSCRRAGVDPPFEVLVRSRVWGRLIRLVDAWFRTPISEATGVSIRQLNELERHVGRPLPAALREWYRLVAGHPTFTDEADQDFEMPLARVGESPRLLRIYGENQEAWYCGILEEHGRLPDPPVYFESFSFDPVTDAGYDPSELIDGRFLRVCDHLTEFVFGMTIRQMVLRLEPSPCLKPEVCGATFDDLATARQVWKRLRLERVLDFPAGFSPAFGEEVLGAEEWGFAARDAEALARVERVVRRLGGRFGQCWG
jgi:hypothetical protein